MTLKTFIDFKWKFRDGKRASKYAYVYRCAGEDREWLAQKRPGFCRWFESEREAGEFVAKQLGATLVAIMVPGWDESMRKAQKVAHAVIDKPKPKSKKMVCRQRKLIVRFIKRPVIGETVHGGRDLVSGVSEQNSAGYEEMQNRGAM